MVSSAPNILVVSEGTGVTSVPELVKLAKERSDLFFGSAGVGTAPHLSGELFNMMTGAEAHPRALSRQQPGPGRPRQRPIARDLRAGADAAAFVRISASRRWPSHPPSVLAHPDLPTLAESGLPGFDTSIWYGFLAPKGTPPQILKLLADALVEAGDNADMKTQLNRNGAEPLSITLDKFGAFIADDIKKWRKVVEFAQIKG